MLLVIWLINVLAWWLMLGTDEDNKEHLFHVLLYNRWRADVLPF